MKDRMKLSLNPQFSKELGFNNRSNARELNPPVSQKNSTTHCKSKLLLASTNTSRKVGFVKE
jgi:hypothetical protein